MGRSRSRSRSRDRDRRGARSSRTERSRSRDRTVRSRSRDRASRRRSRTPDRARPPPSQAAYAAPAPVAVYQDVNAIQAMAALQQQQQLQRQLLQQQMLLQQSTTASSQQADRVSRKQREIYVGNLAVGSVNMDMLRELFNAVLAQMVPDPVTTPPVVDVRVDTSGRFGFVELRTLELADLAIQLDKLEVCGRKLNVARPKDYVENKMAVPTAAKISAAQMYAAGLSGGGAAAGLPLAALAPVLGYAGAALPAPPGTSNVVLLENLLPVGRVRNDSERRELYEDVHGEATVCGTVLGLTIPIPPADVSSADACRVYVKYGNAVEAAKCMRRMDGRSFEENKVKATYVLEPDFLRAQAGEWLATHESPPEAGSGFLPGPPPGMPPPSY
ncbi:MAG: hypothetical protein WDW36_008832 [Sanguina aurantia]